MFTEESLAKLVDALLRGAADALQSQSATVPMMLNTVESQLRRIENLIAGNRYEYEFNPIPEITEIESFFHELKRVYNLPDPTLIDCGLDQTRWIFCSVAKRFAKRCIKVGDPRSLQRTENLADSASQ